MRVLVCGDRKWDDEFAIGTVLAGLLATSVVDMEDLIVIDGAARGADRLAGSFFGGREDGIHAIHDHVFHERYPADWDTYGKAAGPIRNARMLRDGRPDVVFAFHDDISASRGTRDMIHRSVKDGLPTYLVSRQR